jgi:oligopeptide transport system substrate-binding protein
MRTLFVGISLLVAVSVMLTACGSAPATATEAPAVADDPSVTDAPAAATEPPAPVEASILRVSRSGFPDMVDPQKSSFAGEIGILRMVYEGLTRLNEKGETVPGAAEKWEYNADATQITFTLRPGLKYSDGSLLNAARFEYSWRRNSNPATAGQYAAITDDILGAGEWRTCTENCDPLQEAAYESIKASHADGSACTGYEDEACNTFTLKLRQPAPYFHTVAILWVGFPARQELIEAGGENWWLDAANHLGNGPFIMTNLEQGVKVEFEPNPNYWAGIAGYKLEYNYITDGAVSFEAYKNNELDVTGLAAEDLATVENDPVLNAEKNIYAGSCTFCIMFHQLKAPFTDPEVRKAFSYALDREAWSRDILKGLGLPTLTWIPKGWPGYQEGETRYGYDPAKAVKTLTDAGYMVEDGKLIGKDGKPIDIILTFSDTPRNRTRYEWMAAKFKEVLALDLPLNPVEPTAYTALTENVDTAPQMFILGWCADYPDPQNWLSVYWRSNSSMAENIGYSNPDMDRLTEEADKATDPVKRMELYAQAQEVLVSNANIAFMWNDVQSFLVKPWVKGAVANPLDIYYPGDTTPLTITVESD